MVSKALKTVAAIAVALTSTAAVSTISATSPAGLRSSQPVSQAAGMQAGATRNTPEVTAFNDVGLAFGTRARSTDRVQSATTGLPELDNWMLLAAGAVLILMVTQRRMRNVND